VIDRATALYCVVEDLLKAVGHRDDARYVLTAAEVITMRLAAALHFGGNTESSSFFMRETGAIWCRV
jgi:hypothetical protein